VQITAQDDGLRKEYRHAELWLVQRRIGRPWSKGVFFSEASVQRSIFVSHDRKRKSSALNVMRQFGQRSFAAVKRLLFEI